NGARNFEARIFFISIERRATKGPAKTITNIATDSCDHHERMPDKILQRQQNEQNLNLKCEKYVCGKCTIENPIIYKQRGETE
ncbi:unnamed protein product, partial [Heterotrigona itama]